MAQENFGIKKLKEATVFIINLTESVENRYDDGNFSLWDGITLIPQASNVRKYINNSEQIKKEFLDLDVNERNELKKHVVNELDLDDDYVESIIERSLNVLESIGNLIDIIKKDREGKGYR